MAQRKTLLLTKSVVILSGTNSIEEDLTHSSWARSGISTAANAAVRPSQFVSTTYMPESYKLLQTNARKTAGSWNSGEDVTFELNSSVYTTPHWTGLASWLGSDPTGIASTGDAAPKIWYPNAFMNVAGLTDKFKISTPTNVGADLTIFVSLLIEVPA